MKKTMLSGIISGLFLLLSTITLHASVIYDNNFETSVGSEWNTSSTYTTPTFTSLGNTKGLGNFGNTTITLDLSGIEMHDEITVSFELYLQDSWDGNETGSIGPDSWGFSQDGSALLNATFSNLDEFGYLQSYPDGGQNPAHTGASDFNNLGGHYGNSVYELSFTFSHTAETLTLAFTGSGLQSLSDESWGIDNINVTSSLQGSQSVPEPTTMALFGIGLLSLAGFSRRK